MSSRKNPLTANRFISSGLKPEDQTNEIQEETEIKEQVVKPIEIKVEKPKRQTPIVGNKSSEFSEGTSLGKLVVNKKNNISSKRNVTYHLKEEHISQIEEHARQQGYNKSEFVDILLSYALSSLK